MSLSVCLVTRNEEKSIERVLHSVAGVADEVVVVETGSTDRTAALAAERGARVVPFRWDDDFAAARNHALDQATGDWVLWLNPDEELLPAGREQLPGYLARTDVLAFILRVQQLAQPEQTEAVFATPEPRLFRREGAPRYVGRVHCHFTTPLEELAKQQSKQLLGGDLVIRRHLYLNVLDEDKLRWTVRLLEKELKDRPGQLHYLIEYGRTLLWLNDPKAHAILAQATEQLLKVRNAPAAPLPSLAPLLEYLLTVAPQQSRSRILPMEAEELALRWFPNSPPLLWVLAQQAFKREEFRQAASLLERLVHLGRSGAFDRGEAFNPRIIGGPPLMNLGICYVRLGDLNRAEHCFGQLLADPALGQQAKQSYAMVQDLKRQPPPRPGERGVP
jgi:Glycosyl transferase family 2